MKAMGKYHHALLGGLFSLCSLACVAPYQGSADAGTPDSGTITSTIGSGPVEGRLECNPVQNAGCDATANEACVYDPAKDNALCAPLTTRLAHEEPCSPLQNACDRNMTCTALPRDHESQCYHVCDPQNGTGCENLPGTSPNYICTRLVDRTFGLCVGTGVSCDPNEDPCGAMEVCSLSGGQTVCLPAGAAKIGESCAVEQCVKGTVCAKLADLPEPRCFLPCETDEGICSDPDDVCTGIDDQRFGLCQKTLPTCSPLAGAENKCPDGQICSLERTHPTCVAPGPAQVGESCAADRSCVGPGPGANGAVCARLLGEDSAQCYESCDLSFPACTNPGTGCSDIGLAFGICI